MLDATETLIRLGISTGAELRIVAPNYLGGSSKNGTAAGFGDTALGFKLQLGPLPGDVGLSVIIALSLPTGSKSVSSHGFDPFIKFPLSKELRRGWSIGGMQSLFWSTQEGGRNLTWEPTFYLEREIARPLVAFAEYSADVPRLGGLRQLAHFGTAYKIRAKQQIDFHFGFGLSRATPDHFFALGYSFRVDSLWGQ
jgi:outer membrane putative beta-barrel porin/alpha-amylase